MAGHREWLPIKPHLTTAPQGLRFNQLFGWKMSLFSTFYSGDAGLIENAARNGDFDFSEQPGVKGLDFSGGLAQAFMFPEDFLALTGGGLKSFWTLKSKSLTNGEDQGLYRVPDAECDRIVRLQEATLSGFSTEWNRRRVEDAARIERSRSIWRSRPYWSITGGISFGILLSYMANPGSVVPLIVLAVWLALAVVFALYVTRRRKLKANHRPKPVDWSMRIRDLQRFLREARQSGSPVYYHWSL